MRAAALIATVVAWGVFAPACQKSSPSTEPPPGAGNATQAMVPSMGMGRPASPARPAWKPDPTKRCPVALPGVRVELSHVPKGVQVAVRSGDAAIAKQIQIHARYLEAASRRAPRPEQALEAAPRQRCPVVLLKTSLQVAAHPQGADIVVSSTQPKGGAALRRLARERLHRAFPLPKVSAWKCGALKDPPTPSASTLQPHQRAWLFSHSPQEQLVPTGWDSGDTTISNEARLELFRKVVLNRRGGYVGVGSTQNFVLAAWADVEWVWLMDFTRIVVDANKTHIAFIEASPSYSQFLALWQPANKAAGLRLIRKRYAQDPGLKKIEHAYLTAARFVTKRFGQLAGWAKQHRYATWLNDAKLYGRIRRLALRGRIRALRGDLNGPHTLCGIGEAARRMGVRVRILYTSNAEEYKVFRPYKWTFRRNVRNLPADDKSLVLRTYTFSPSRLPWPQGWKGVSKVGFHYNAQPLGGFQNLLKLPKLDVKQVMTRATDADRDGFSLIQP